MSLSRFAGLLLAAALVLPAASASAAGPITLQWSDLIPAGTDAPQISLAPAAPGGLGHSSNVPGSVAGIKALQPPSTGIRAELDGQEVQIAGFVAPLEFDGLDLAEFLLVPYAGACIHVPPPPANQIVHIADAQGFQFDGLMVPVWVTGTLRAVPLDTNLAEVGYQIVDPVVVPYED